MELSTKTPKSPGNFSHTGESLCPICAKLPIGGKFGGTYCMEFTRPCVSLPLEVVYDHDPNDDVVQLSATVTGGVKNFVLTDAPTVRANITSDTATVRCDIPDGSATFHLASSALWLTVGRKQAFGPPPRADIDVFVREGCAIHLSLIAGVQCRLVIHGDNSAVTLTRRDPEADVAIHFSRFGRVYLAGSPPEYCTHYVSPPQKNCEVSPKKNPQ
jgi:hypothetical protein